MYILGHRSNSKNETNLGPCGELKKRVCLGELTDMYNITLQRLTHWIDLETAACILHGLSMPTRVLLILYDIQPTVIWKNIEPFVFILDL